MNAPSEARLALQKATRAFRRGQKRAARRLAARAAALAPHWEDPWLLLAALTDSPRASIGYLEKALEINPNSRRARQGMAWAARRLRERPAPAVSLTPPSPRAYARKRKLWPLALAFLALTLTLWAFASGIPASALALTQPQLHPNAVFKPTLTPTPTNTPTPTPTPTPTFTPSPTPTATPTFTPSPTAPPPPPPTPPPPQPPSPPITLPSGAHGLPPGVGAHDKWIDVNLSRQRLYAYVGTQLVRQFIVSTGIPAYPTVTGTYRIYVKYVATLMTGPGYYLPNVPYTMYFYRGYGIHGTYWHHNFGVPMSHGCVNMRTPEAKWLFYWAPLGTIVHIHY